MNDVASSVALEVIWRCLCTAFVLLMVSPGFAFYYGGMVRRKNVLSMMLQCVYLSGVIGLTWALVAHSIAFGTANRFWGGTEFLFMRGMHGPEGMQVGHWGRFLFHGAVVVVTGIILCGSFAERMRFKAMTIFSVAWTTCVYAPLCHWVWGGGFLDPRAPHALLGGVWDFGGGLVIHVSAGVAGVLGAIIVGKRLGFRMDDMRPHNLTYALLGAALLWVGALFLHAGHSPQAGALALNAFVFTNLSVAAGAITWAIFEWMLGGRASALGTVSGAIAGIVCAASAAGYVHPFFAVLIAPTAALACLAICRRLSRLREFDDPLDVFGLHAVAGVIGLLATALLASPEVNGLSGVCFGGGWKPLLAQLAAMAIGAVWVGVGTLVVLKLLDMTIGLRVSQENEMRGLDVAQHGQEGYIFN